MDLRRVARYLTGPEGSHGSAEYGRKLFAKAQCINCHRFGARGDGIGPDLSTVSRRFQKKEILESILFPSQVISDQYASKTVLTTDGRSITGLAAPQADGSLIVLQSNGQKASIQAADIEKIIPSKVSAMPEGLLNSLTLEEIADLFSYLNQSAEANVAGQGTGSDTKANSHNRRLAKPTCGLPTRSRSACSRSSGSVGPTVAGLYEAGF